MNWGTSLLIDWDGIFQPIMFKIQLGLYSIGSIIFSFLYKIWALLGSLVDVIEGIFRNLAGVGNSGAGDMAGIIIQNDVVKTIFQNLVGISVALLIFFTILKILQQQYKEKEGGNPYLIVFRMFKGLMMFFFVTAAVLVGLYASGVVFSALDTATNPNGGKTLSATVFKNMSGNANRMKIGKTFDSDVDDFYYSKFWSNLGNSGLETEKTWKMSDSYYSVVEKGANSKTKTMAQMRDSLPAYNWGLVSADGKTITPLYNLSTSAFKDTPVNEDDYWAGTIYDPNEWNQFDSDFDITDGGNGNYGVAGEATYTNDIFNSIDIALSPRVDLSWSPIDMYDTRWEIRRYGNTIPENITIHVMGSGVEIPMGYGYYKFTEPETTESNLDFDNLFSIDLSAHVSFQGGKASASFDLNTYASQEPFDKILGTLMCRIVMQQLVKTVVGSLPEMPLFIYIGPIGINLARIASSILSPMLNSMLTGLVVGMSRGGIGNISDIVEWDASQDTAPVTLHEIRWVGTENFLKLWSNFANSIDEFKEQLQKANESDLTNIQYEKEKANKKVAELGDQRDWIYHKGYVDDYNKKIKKYLISLCDYASRAVDATDYANHKDEIDNGVRAAMRNLVTEHTTMRTFLDKLSPRNGEAMGDYGEIYLPAFETDLDISNIGDREGAATLLPKLANSHLNLASGNGQVITQVVNWDAYPSTVVNSYNIRGQADSARSLDDVKYMDISELKLGWLTGRSVNGTLISLPDFTKPHWNKKVSLGQLKFADQFSVNNHADAYQDYSNPNLGVSALELRASRVNDTSDTFIENFLKPLSASKEERAAVIPDSMKTYTFRRLTPSSDGKDSITVNADMVSTRPVCYLRFDPVSSMSLQALVSGGASQLSPRSTVSAFGTEAIDTLVGNCTDNLYLMETYREQTDKDGNVKQEETFKKYVGKMTYKDATVVSALYDFTKMNLLIAYMCIIVAMGVYLNFMFGLIQRAVNLAVLYMMSPITIAFFPFDDGSKFNSAFVMPFYKETISSFSIIISLNMFLSLFGPVTKAVATATNGGIFMELLATIAFVSMLPKIRDSITNLLGANSIQSKSIGSMFKDAKNTLGSDFNELKGGLSAAKKKAMKAGRNIGKFKDAAYLAKGKIADRLKNTKLAKGAGWVAGKVKNLKPVKAVSKGINKVKGGVKNFGESARNAWNRLKGKATEADQAKADELIKQSGGDLSKIDPNDNSMGAKLARKRLKAAGGDVNKAMSDEIRDKVGKGNIVAKGLSGGTHFLGKLTHIPFQALGLAAKAGKDVAGFAGGVIKDSALFQAMLGPGGILMDGNSLIGNVYKWNLPAYKHQRREKLKDEALFRGASHDRADKERISGIRNAYDAQTKMNEAQDLASRTNAAAKQAQHLLQQDDATFRTEYVKHMSNYYQQQEGLSAADATKKAADKWDSVAQYIKKNPRNKKEQEDSDYARHELNTIRSDFAAQYQSDLVKERYGSKITDFFLQDGKDTVSHTLRTMDAASIMTEKNSVNNNLTSKVTEILTKVNGGQDPDAALVKSVTESVKKGETVENITKQIAASTSLDQNALLKNMETSGLAGELGNLHVGFKADMASLDGMTEVLKQKAAMEKTLSDSFGLNPDSAAVQKALDSWRLAMDVNSPEGQHAELAALKQKYPEGSPEYMKGADEIAHKWMSRLESQLSNLISDSKILEHSYKQRYDNDIEASSITNVGKTFAKAFENAMRNADDIGINKIHGDAFTVNAMQKGDVGAVADAVKSMLGAATRGDVQTIQANTQFDEQTRNYFAELARGGDASDEKIAGLMRYADTMKAAAGGGKTAIDGTDVFSSAISQTNAILSLTITKQMEEFASRAAQIHQQNEQQLLFGITQKMGAIKDGISGKNWDDLLSKGLNINMGGRPFNEYFESMMNKVTSGTMSENSPEWKQLRAALADAMSDPAKLEQYGLDKTTGIQQLQEILGQFNSGFKAIAESSEAAKQLATKKAMLGIEYEAMQKMDHGSKKS